jgi:hypothetical protein
MGEPAGVAWENLLASQGEPAGVAKGNVGGRKQKAADVA